MRVDNIGWKNIFRKMMLLGMIVSWGVGVLLLSINILGSFHPLRSPDIYQQKTGFLNDLSMDVKDAYKIIDKKNENVKDYVKEVTFAVSQTILHYWEDDKIDEFHIRIPWYENYLYFVMEKLGWFATPGHEFCNPRRALDRGVGLCTQVSITLSKILESKGIENKVIAFKEHTIVTALVDKEKGEWWILDPDYGVTLEGNLDDVSVNFDLLYRKEYEKVKYRSNDVVAIEKLVDNLREIYKNQDYGLDMDLYIETTCELERKAYFLKLFLPILSLLVGFILRIIFFRKKRV